MTTEVQKNLRYLGILEYMSLTIPVFCNRPLSWTTNIWPFFSARFEMLKRNVSDNNKK